MNFIKENKIKLILTVVIIAVIALVLIFVNNSGNTEPKDEKIQLENGQVIDVNSDKSICSLSVRCDAILSNMDLMDKEKVDIVPKDGAILKNQDVEFIKGESVFDLLVRITQEKKIHMDFQKSAGNTGAYVRGIGNIYEFDCGDMSGWTYLVNGKSPNVSYDKYIVQEGDIIEWVYICSFDESMQ